MIFVFLTSLSMIVSRSIHVAVNGIIFWFFFFFLIYFWVFAAVHRLSLVATSGGYSSLQCSGFLLWWLLLLQSMGSRYMGFSSCGTWAQ